MPILAYFSPPTHPSSRALGLLILLTAMVGACSSAPEAGIEPPPEGWVTLPTEFQNEYFFVRFQVDDDPDRQLVFLYDTGANITVVDPESLTAATSWEPSQGQQVRFGHLQSGNLRLGDLSAQAYDLDHLQHAIGRSFDGILGYNAFDRLLVELDYPNARMRVAEGSLPAPDGLTVFPLVGDERPLLEAEIEGRTRRLLVDTGSGMGFDLQPRRGWSWAVDPVTVGSSMAIDGLNLYQAGRLNRPIHFLGRSYRQPLVRVTDSVEIVGTEVLRDYHLTFDMKYRRLRILTGLPACVPPAPYLGTGAIFRPEADGLVVLEILDGSPAERVGLRVGDEVQRVAMTPGVHRRMSVEGQTYRLRRGNRHMQLDIPFANLIPIPEAVGPGTEP